LLAAQNQWGGTIRSGCHTDVSDQLAASGVLLCFINRPNVVLESASIGQNPGSINISIPGAFSVPGTVLNARGLQSQLSVMQSEAGHAAPVPKPGLFAVQELPGYREHRCDSGPRFPIPSSTIPDLPHFQHKECCVDGWKRCFGQSGPVLGPWAGNYNEVRIKASLVVWGDYIPARLKMACR